MKADLIKGALAGAAATWVMGQVTTLMYGHEEKAARAREDSARGGKTAYGVAAEKLAHAAGVELSDDARKQSGQAIHWTLGIATGAAYALMRKRWPATAAVKGLPFGAAFFLIVDEAANALLGLTPGPMACPWQAHARGLGGHLAYAAATEMVLEGLDKVA